MVFVCESIVYGKFHGPTLIVVFSCIPLLQPQPSNFSLSD